MRLAAERISRALPPLPKRTGTIGKLTPNETGGGIGLRKHFFNGAARLLTLQMLGVLLVFQANVIQQLRIGRNDLLDLDGPRLSVGLRIVARHLDLQRSVVHAPESFRDPGGIRERTAPCV